MVGATLDGRHRPRKRGPCPRPQARSRDQRRGCGLAAGPRRETGPAVRGHQRLRAPRRRAQIRGSRNQGDRPDACSGRPWRDPTCQPARAPRGTERQHGHLRRPGHHPDGLRGVARRRCAVRRDRGVGVVGVGGPWDACEHRRVHQDHQRGRREHRRCEAGQGDHHPEPRGSADDHARHHLLRDSRRRRPRRHHPVHQGRGGRGADLCARLPAAQRAAVRRADGVQRRQPRRHHIHRGGGCGRLSAALRWKPGHHDRGGDQGRRGDRQRAASATPEEAQA